MARIEKERAAYWYWVCKCSAWSTTNGPDVEACTHCGTKRPELPEQAIRAQLTLQRWGNSKAYGRMVRENRGSKGLRPAAKEIGISHTTLARVEDGRNPSLDCFMLIEKWLVREVL